MDACRIEALGLAQIPLRVLRKILFNSCIIMRGATPGRNLVHGRHGIASPNIIKHLDCAIYLDMDPLHRAKRTVMGLVLSHAAAADAIVLQREQAMDRRKWLSSC
jgi:hypothetical protein